MITRKNFLIMGVTMFVLLFLFQFSQIMKESGNEYDVNHYAVDAGLEGEDAWQKSPPKDVLKKGDYVLFVGNGKSDIGKTVSWWCTYTKRELMVCQSVEECPEDVSQKAEVLLLESSYVREKKDIEALTEMVRRGGTLVFCDLPDVPEIKASRQWKELLGIRQVKELRQEIKGVNLFSGFLLGGQAIYLPADAKEKQERQDLEHSIPWYETTNGCKTYMTGIVSDPSVKNEELPPLIWRVGLGKGKVFAVNGDYMKDCTGIGMLSAILAEIKPYDLYPVVNAQCMGVANFPGLAAENSERMKELYSRELPAVFRDIIWPGLCSAVDKSGAHLTCYLAPQFDYGDDKEPRKDQLVFYLRQLKEREAEAGLTLEYVSAGDLTRKMNADQSFFQNSGSQYRYGAAYIPPGGAAYSIEKLKDYAFFEHIQTVASIYSAERPVVSYLDDKTTLQSITSTGISHTYKEDIRMKSLQTALGYSNIVLDMNQITWPEEEEDRWEIVSEKFSSQINTYWKAFEMFDQTSASECDTRIRNFLAMDYEDSREGDEIHVSIKERNGDLWFIFRAHGEKVVSVQGGDFTKIETDAYLIRAGQDELTIRCQPEDSLYYYLP
ncbi:MAG: DUF2194 domain-containing protein [Eubacterium sp.]|nr:DUF2194 domain-containing protein [Eubacterium sp.]